MSSMIDVAIVGAGIAGLATAYELSRRGLSCVVLERAPRAGGVIFCEELGLGGRLVSTKPPRIAYIQRGGRLYALPAASVLGIPTRIGPFARTRLFTWSGKIRMGAELFIPP